MTEGEVLVPREPTDEMSRAGYKVWNDMRVVTADLIYKAMIAAAPPKEAEPWRPDMEAVARMIDPQAWALIDHWRAKPERLDLISRIHREAQPSLAKADAILALFHRPIKQEAHDDRPQK